MLNTIIKKNIILLFPIISFFLTSCSLFEKDNLPPPSAVPRFRSEIHPRQLWSVQAGQGSMDEYLKMGMGLKNNLIFVSSVKGTLTAIDQTTGKRIWQVETGLPITTAPTPDGDVLIVGTRQGDVVAYSQSNCGQIWRVNVGGEIIAKPVISGKKVIIKSTNGYVYALSLFDGHELWSYQQTEPSLILRGSSTPVVRSGSVIVGFANGNLAKLHLSNGDATWVQSIAQPNGAFAVQRMVDINADPVLYGHRIFAATYQGKIAALTWDEGNIRWSQELSSYTGMVVDEGSVFISDAKSHLWRFSADNGDVIWNQNKLAYRGVTAPAEMNNYLIVADNDGYVFWLSKDDGHFVGIANMMSPILATPVVVNNTVYLLTTKGRLTALSVM